MPRLAAVLLLAILAAGAPSARDSLSPGLRFLLENERVCAPDERVCLRATLSYEPNLRLLDLQGRVLATTAPGELVIVLVGRMRDGSRRFAEMRLRLDGRYGEIVDKRMVPDWPEIYDWRMYSLDYRLLVDD